MIVSRSDTDNDDPISITLSLAYSEATVVMTSTYQTFRFNISLDKLYVNNVNWGIQYCSKSGQYFVKAGEFVSYNSNMFKIERFDDEFTVYKIIYCQFSIEKCFNVGRYYGSLFCSFSVQIYRLGALGGLWLSSAVLARLSLLP
nr:sporamin B [Ipomoea batatas]